MKVSIAGPNSFDRIATYLWSENQTEAAPATSPMVSENPLRQLWIETAKGMLPTELAGHLDQADSVRTCMDWFGVAAIYGRVSGSRLERRTFLTELDGNPDPARVLNAAITARIAVQTEPTLRDRDWVRLDWFGQALLVVLLVLLLCARGAVMHLAALEWPRLGPCFGLALHYWVGGGDSLPTLMPTHGWAAGLWLLVVAAWLSFEFLLGPALMERVRQLPARWYGYSPHVSTRPEALYGLWRLQCVGTLAYWIICWLTSGVDRGGRNVERVIVMCNQWMLAVFST